MSTAFYNPNWLQENSGSENRIYRNPTQCVENWTVQLVANDVI